MHLDETNENFIAENFPRFIEKNKRYFFIVDDVDEDIGLYGLKSKDNYEEGCVEISLFVFKDKRYHKQYKKILIYLLNYPFFVNYKSILIHTEETSIRTFLKMCKRLNIIPLNTSESWFYRGEL